MDMNSVEPLQPRDQLERWSRQPVVPDRRVRRAFWLHQAAFEFLSSRLPACRSTNAAPRHLAERVLATTRPLPCGDWRWPGGRQRLRYHGDSLAMGCDDDDLFWLMLGAPDEAALAAADDLPIEWDESDSRR